MSTTKERQLIEENIKTFYIDKNELEFGNVIGKGGFGMVFVGKFKGKSCAIKSIYVPVNMRYSVSTGSSEDIYLDFLNEMTVQLLLDHTNLLRTYGWSSDDTCVYVVMELMPFSLSKLLKSTVPEYKFTPKYEDVVSSMDNTNNNNGNVDDDDDDDDENVDDENIDDDDHKEKRNGENDGGVKMQELRPSRRKSDHGDDLELDENGDGGQSRRSQKRRKKHSSSRSSTTSSNNHSSSDDHGKKVIRKSRPVILSNQMKLQIALDIAEGMEYLHTRQKLIIHRDLKSMNVLLSNDLTCCICDFGFAAMRNQQSGISGMKGTYGWCSPEMIRCSKIKDGRKCDVYSYGMIIYELLTHKVPFYYASNPFVVTNDVLQGKRSSLDQKIEKDGKLLKDYDGNDCEIVKALLNLYITCTSPLPEDRPGFLDIIYELQNVPVSTKIQYVVDSESKSSGTTFSSIQEAINAIPNSMEQSQLIEKQRGIVESNTNTVATPAIPLLKISSSDCLSPSTPIKTNSGSIPTPRSFIKSTTMMKARNFVDLEELKQRARAMLFTSEEPPLDEIISTPLTAVSSIASVFSSPRTAASPRTPSPLDSPHVAGELRPIRPRKSFVLSQSPLAEQNMILQKEKNEELQIKKRKEEKRLLQRARLIDKTTGLPYTIDKKRKIILSNNTLKPPLIKIRPGVYRESIQVDRNVQLVGQESSDQKHVIIEQPDNFEPVLASVQSCTNVSIQNIIFRNPNLMAKSPIVKITRKSHGITISKCRFNGVQLEVDDFSEPAVSKCTITHCNLNTGGLYIHNDSKGHFIDNSFSNNAHSNITISHNADPIIEFNDIFKSQSVGILCSHQGKGWITRNEIYDNLSHGIQIHTGAEPMIEHNEIDHNEGRGIDCGYMSSGIIRQNNIAQNLVCPQVKVNDDSTVIIEGNNHIDDVEPETATGTQGGLTSDEEFTDTDLATYDYDSEDQ